MRNKSLLSLSNELKILHLATLEKELTQKMLEKNGLDFRDPVGLLNSGYLTVKGKNEFPYCSYQITQEGKRYSEEILNWFNTNNFLKKDS